MTWLIENAIQPDIGVSLAEMIVEPGETTELHSHSNCSEFIYCLSGEISQRIGDQWSAHKPGDLCVIPEGTCHQTRNDGEMAARVMLIYTSGEREYLALPETD